MCGGLIVLTLCATFFVAETKLTGDNVCRTRVTSPEIAVEWQLKNGTIRQYQWCWNVPPRCSIYTRQFLNETREVVRNVTRLVEFCCDGYREQDDLCVEECSASDCKTSTTKIEPPPPPTVDLLKSAVQNNDSNVSGTTQDSRVIFLNPYDENSDENDRSSVESVDESPIFYIKKNIEYSTRRTDEQTTDLVAPVDISDEFENDTHNSSELFLQGLHQDERSDPTTEMPTIKMFTSAEKNIFYEESSVEVTSQDYTKPAEMLDLPQESRENGFLSFGNHQENLNELLPRPNNSYVLHGIIIALSGTVVVIIFTLVFLTVKSARDKKNKENKQKSVSHVAVYTTSIFHTPLPEPPTFDNPTYLTSSQPLDSNYQNEPLKTFEPRIINSITSNPHTMHLTETRDYVYDHPPSTGSYRAASSVDGLSIIGESTTKTVSEPVYDEIPCKDNNNVQQESLYVNTLCRTRF